MIEITWAAGLRDHRAQALIAARLLRLVRGISGDTAPIGDGVHELRIHYGPGYPLYYLKYGMTIVVLLCGGDKSTQKRDIQVAKRLARQWRAARD
jgi:putative addiction module killer protein